ncbi:hypothetical protein MUP35_04240 [Patescibacteria group bacterium]|nr:hypothetical protein [Patescibacteria group bacterium]
MLKKWMKITIIVVYLLGIFYLVLPEPVIPNLSGALKSIEPGDTVQIPGVWAYYTNLSRREAIDFYKEAFSRSSFLKIPLPTYILNHPPEYARETIIDTHKNNFYEELVHPLRESLFISGWIPKEDEVYLAKNKKPITEFLVEGQTFSAKITLYHVQSPLWARFLVWTGIVFLGLMLISSLKTIFLSPWGRRK